MRTSSRPSYARFMATAFAAIALVGFNAMAADLPDFTGLVERYGPAVVNVQSIVSATDSQAQAQTPDQQDIPEIFRHFFGPMPRVPQQGERRSMGSGFIISADGYVLTNNHVVGDADQVTVKLPDRRELDAKVIGRDPETDIALLKINATGLPVVSIGDSAKLKPGQWVVALGSPFGFDHSVTHGIVSAIGRGFGDQDQRYIPFIQTDVPINPGNSGGPLFNLDGKVVGINSQIFSNTGGFMGVSFAIPIDVAMNTVAQLKEKGHVTRGMIGVQVQNVDRDKARALGLPRSGGALVNSVSADSAAAKAGMRVGDVILSFNGVDVVGSSDLPPLVGMTPPGTRVSMSVFRDGKIIDVPVVVAELPQDKTQLAATTPKANAASNVLGIAVEDLTAEQRAQLSLKDEGVLVTAVTGVAARQAALQAGDVVLMVGRQTVKTAAGFNAALKGLKPGDSVMLLVRRDDITTFIAINVPKSSAQ